MKLNEMLDNAREDWRIATDLFHVMQAERDKATQEKLRKAWCALDTAFTEKYGLNLWEANAILDPAND